jgi:hypothetical protein
MIFLLPLCLASCFTIAFLSADEAPHWKVVAAIVLVASLVLQFVVPIHFLIPLLIQIALSIVFAFYYQIR